MGASLSSFMPNDSDKDKKKFAKDKKKLSKDKSDEDKKKLADTDFIGHMCDTFVSTRCNFSRDRFVESSLLKRELEKHFYQTSGVVPWVHITDNRPLHFKQSNYILFQYLVPRLEALGCGVSTGWRGAHDWMIEPTFITGMNVNFY